MSESKSSNVKRRSERIWMLNVMIKELEFWMKLLRTLSILVTLRFKIEFAFIQVRIFRWKIAKEIKIEVTKHKICFWLLRKYEIELFSNYIRIVQ